LAKEEKRVRGNKIWNIALILSLVLPMLAFVAPVPAQASSLMSVPTIDNPLMAPGETFAIDVLVNNVVELWRVAFTLNYDTSVLTATGIVPNPTDPVASKGFIHTTSDAIDDTTGTIVVDVDRGLSGYILGQVIGIGDGVTKTFFVENPRIGDRNGDAAINRFDVDLYYDGVLQLPTEVRDVTATGRIRIATASPAPAVGVVVSLDYFHPGLTVDANFPALSISFSIDSRGASPLDMSGSAMTDIYMNPIAVDEIDGSFINTFHGHIAAPLVKNTTLVLGNEFDVIITADNVRTPAWGVSFWLDYDTNVLTALSSVTNPYVDDTLGTTYVEVAGLSLTTVDPVPLVTVRFRVDAEGWSILNIRDVAGVSIFGDLLVFDNTDGSFASVNPIDFTGRGAWPDTYWAMYGTIDMLHAKVKTSSTGLPITFQVVFSIYDLKGGFLLGTIETAPATIPELTTMEVTAPFDTTVWGTPKHYWWFDYYMVRVRAKITYDSNGDGIMDSVAEPEPFGHYGHHWHRPVVRDFYIFVYKFNW